MVNEQRMAGIFPAIIHDLFLYPVPYPPISQLCKGAQKEQAFEEYKEAVFTDIVIHCAVAVDRFSVSGTAIRRKTVSASGG